jgi:hypothetical protein
MRRRREARHHALPRGLTPNDAQHLSDLHEAVGVVNDQQPLMTVAVAGARCFSNQTEGFGMKPKGSRVWSSGQEGLGPVTTGFWAADHPMMPAGRMNTLVYPSAAACRAAVWHAVQCSL